jgi:hypothetical protein
MMTQTTCSGAYESDAHSILGRESEPSRRPAWHERIFSDLTEVAELLDSLEVCEVEDRKLYTVGCGLFLVRWRC